MPVASSEGLIADQLANFDLFQLYLEFFKNFLIRWLEELLANADETVDGLLDSQVNPADPLDRASVESDRIWTLRIRDRESMLIKKIRQSLEDIENGEYGICEDCGEDILEKYKTMTQAEMLSEWFNLDDSPQE